MPSRICRCDGVRSAAAAETCTGRTTRPRPVWAQMIVAFGCRFSRFFICVRYTGSVSSLPNGMSMSLCRMTTRPLSAANSRILSSAGLVRLAVSPAIFDETNSLWMLNSPMPVKTPGKVVRTRRMWSTPYMSAGLKPVIIGSNRAWASFGSAR